MEHFTNTFHFSSLFMLLFFVLAGAAAEDRGPLVEVVPPVSLLCISECSTCPAICAPPPSSTAALKSPPPVPHAPPLTYFPLNSPPSPSPSPPRPTPSPPSPAAASFHPPPPPAFKYYFSLPPPPPVLIPVPVPPTTAAPHGDTNAYNYYFYAPESSSPSLPGAFFWGLFLFHLLLSSW